MKNIMMIDGAVNCVYDIYSATEDEFYLIFRKGEDIAFIDEVFARGNQKLLDAAFDKIWDRRIQKSRVSGIDGILFYELEYKKVFYATRRDEEACNPDGSKLRP